MAAVAARATATAALVAAMAAATAVMVTAAAVAPALAQDVPRATATVDTLSTALGGRLLAAFDVTWPPGWQVEPLSLESKLGGFAVRRSEEVARTDTSRRFEVDLVPLETGAVEIPAVSWTARNPAGEVVAVASEPLTVDVQSNLPPAPADTLSVPGAPAPSAATPELSPDKPALTAPRDWRPIWIALAAFVLATILGFYVLRRLRRRAPAAAPEPELVRVPTRPAWEIALEELDRIAAADFVERGELRRQYDEVTEALRRYLENRYGVPALESTTDELRARLPGSPLPPEQASRVLSLLAEADLIKFAKGQPDPSEARHSERRARDVVLATRPSTPAATASVPPPPPAAGSSPPASEVGA